MPTGYTAPIYEGQDLSLSEYAQRCARAFGALMSLRDEPLSNSIPDKIESSTYYNDMLAKVQREYEEFLQNPPTIAFAEAEYDKLIAKEMEDMARQNAKAKELELRYRALLDKVNAWQPPTPEHTGLKSFMVRQLELSIEADCSIRDTPNNMPYKDDFINDMVNGESLKLLLEHYKDRVAKEDFNNKLKNEWIKQLKDSLME